MDQRCRFENANFVFVGRSDFSRVGAAIECRDADVVVNCAGNDLYTFKCTRKNDDVTACCVRLQICGKIVSQLKFFFRFFRAAVIMTTTNKCLQNLQRRQKITSKKKKKKTMYRENTIKSSGEEAESVS